MIIEKWTCARCFKAYGNRDEAVRCCPNKVYRNFVCPECGLSYSQLESAERCHGCTGGERFYGVGRHAYNEQLNGKDKTPVPPSDNPTRDG